MTSQVTGGIDDDNDDDRNESDTTAASNNNNKDIENENNALAANSNSNSNSISNSNPNSVPPTKPSPSPSTINVVLHLYKANPNVHLGLLLADKNKNKNNNDNDNNNIDINQQSTHEQYPIVKGLPVNKKNQKSSLLLMAPINVGYSLLAINNHSCRGWTAQKATEMLKTLQGYITLQFCHPPKATAFQAQYNDDTNTTNPSGNNATHIFIHSHCQRLGIQCEKHDNKLIIKEIQPNGLIAKYMSETNILNHDTQQQQQQPQQPPKFNFSFWNINDIILSVNGFSDPDDINQILQITPTLNIILLSSSNHHQPEEQQNDQGQEVVHQKPISPSIIKNNNNNNNINNSDVILLGDQTTRNTGVTSTNTYTATVTKQTKQDKIGIVLTNKEGQIQVKKIPHGLLQNSGIHPGMVLLKINDIDCTDSTWTVASAIQILKSIEGKFTLTFQLPDSPYTYSSITVFKDETQYDIGIALYAKHGRLYVKRPSINGLFSQGETLQTGQPLFQINEHYVAHWDVDQTIALLYSLVGYITIVVGNNDFINHNNNNKSYIIENNYKDTRQVVVTKQSKNDTLGIVLKNIDGDTKKPIYISKIIPNSIFWNQGAILRVNDIVESINDVPMNNVPDHAARSLIKNTPNVVTIVTVNNDNKHSGPTCVPPATIEQVPVQKLLPEVDASIEVYKSGRSSVVATLTDMDFVGTLHTDDYDNNDNNVGSDPGAQQQQRQQHVGRPGLMAAYVYKPTAETRLGITFCQDQQTKSILIDKILGGALLSTSTPFFLPGDKLIRINDWFVHGWSAQEVVATLRSLVGNVTIIVETPSANHDWRHVMVRKSAPSDKLGLVFANQELSEGGLLTVGKVNPGGLLMGKRSILCPGDLVVSVNDLPLLHCKASVARDIAKNAPDIITIITKSPNMAPDKLSSRNVVLGWSSVRFGDCAMAEAILSESQNVHEEIVQRPTDKQNNNDENNNNHHQPTNNNDNYYLPCNRDELPEFISIRVEKPTTSTRLGLFLTNNIGSGGILTIDKIQCYGLLSQTPLRQGYEILSINNQRSHDLTSTQGIQFLKNLKGKLTIVAHNGINGNPSFVLATVMKLSPQGSVGVSFTRRHGRLVIKQIMPQGLFVDSVLNPGDIIFSINGKISRDMSPTDAVNEIRRSIQMVTIHAKTLSSTAVVVAEST